MIYLTIYNTTPKHWEDNLPAPDLDLIDIPASVAEFRQRVTSLLQEAYPEMTITWDDTPNTYATRLTLDLDDDDPIRRDDITDATAFIIQLVWDAGKFWTPK